jgi:hypothetical protein
LFWAKKRQIAESGQQVTLPPLKHRLPRYALIEFVVRQAKLGASCRVKVPVGRGIGMISRKG